MRVSKNTSSMVLQDTCLFVLELCEEVERVDEDELHRC